MKAARSLRWHLQAWHGAVLLIVLCVFGAAAAELAAARRERDLDAQLRERVLFLVRALRPERPGPPEAPPPPPFGPDDDGPPAVRPGPDPGSLALKLNAAEQAEFSATTGFYYVVWLKNGGRPSHGHGRQTIRSADAPPSVPPPQFVPVERGASASAEPPADRPNAQVERAVPRALSGPANPGPKAPPDGPPGLRTRGEWREAIGPLQPGDFILVGHSLAPLRTEARRFDWLLGGAGAAVLLLGWAGGAWFTGRALRPLREMGAAAAEFAAGDLSRRVRAPGAATELADLAEALNSTFARLEGAFGQQARFTADAAHELRTPVSVVLMQTQNGLDVPGLPADARQALAACQRSAQRMRRLIESLLELARWDAGKVRLSLQSCDLARIAGAEREGLRSFAEAAGVRLEAELAPAPCSADPDRLAQVAANLLHNALQHSPAGRAIRLRTRTDGNRAVLEILDEGPGIAPAHLPHIFERFYQADPARSGGRAGLGLSICQAIIDAHGGRIAAENRPTGGACFRVDLPIHENP